MCLAVPVRIVSKEGYLAEVELEGVRRAISLHLTPEAKVGDYVLVHAGYAISVVDAEQAEETLELLRQLNEVY